MTKISPLLLIRLSMLYSCIYLLVYEWLTLRQLYPVQVRHIRTVSLRKMAEDVETVADIALQKQVIRTQMGKTMVKGQTWYITF